jgi:hypothetical protein
MATSANTLAEIALSLKDQYYANTITLASYKNQVNTAIVTQVENNPDFKLIQNDEAIANVYMVISDAKTADEETKSKRK